MQALRTNLDQGIKDHYEACEPFQDDFGKAARERTGKEVLVFACALVESWPSSHFYVHPPKPPVPGKGFFR
jgi:hypothetical protein